MSYIEKRFAAAHDHTHYRSEVRKSKGPWFCSRAEAVTWSANAQLATTASDAKRARLVFRDYVTRVWLPRAALRPSTREVYDNDLRLHVYPVIGDIPIGRLRKSHGSDLITAVEAKGLAPATVKRIWGMTSGVLNYATSDDALPRNPFKGLRPKGNGEDLDRTRQVNPADLYTAEQIWALHAAMPEVYAPIILVAAGTGMRQGEIFGLRPGSVSVARQEITVAEQLQTVGSDVQFGPPKTAKGYRTIPAPRTVIDAIAEHLERHPLPPPSDGTYADGYPIFRSPRGQGIRRNRFSEVFGAARTAAGIPDRRTFHDLRDFYASALINARCDVKVVMERLGHASSEETLRTYTKLWPGSEDATRGAIDGALGSQPTAPV